MNAKEAKQLTIQSKDIVGYVENEISEDVQGLFYLIKGERK